MWNFAYLDTLALQPLRHARLFATGSGEGPSLLFVHGGFYGAWCWAPFLEFFRENGIGCGAVDLRGHGGQTQGDDFPKHGIAEMAEDVHDSAAAMGGNIVLVGHSAGALTALRAASAIKPAGLILISPAAPANVDFKRAPLPEFASDHAIAVPSDERIRKWFLQGIPGNTDIATIASRLCPESPAFMNDCFARGVAFERALVACPTFCLSGGRDQSPLHARGQDQAVAAFLSAEIETIPDAGHSLMIEPLWRAGAVAILGWLRRTGIVPIKLA